MTDQLIRDQDQYKGVRVLLAAGLATARERFHVDVNVGDPIWLAPSEVELPRLLGQPPISLRGYPMEMVLAEKIVTALQLGIASTHWRDFGDIYQLTCRYHLNAQTVREALRAVATYRNAELSALAEELDGYAEVAQSKWFAWRSRHDLRSSQPSYERVPTVHTATGTLEVTAWFDEKPDGERSRRSQLNDPERLSTIRMEMRTHLRRLRAM